MGAGKSTLGQLIASEFDWQYFDNDLEMTARYGFSQDQLASMPVDQLHALESRYLTDVLAQNAPFITGAAASVVDYPANRKLLLEATSIYLCIPLEKVIARAGSSGVGRQAIAFDGEKILTERYLRRDPLYKEVAALTIELSENPQHDAEVIMKFLRA